MIERIAQTGVPGVLAIEKLLAAGLSLYVDLHVQADPRFHSTTRMFFRAG